MFKKNVGKSVFSCFVTLLPMIFGFAVWTDLPATMATHWGADGVADGFGYKVFAVVGIPLVLLAVQVLMLLFLSFSKEAKTQNPKILAVTYWIIPVLSVLVNGITYAVALKKEFEYVLLMPLLLGALFVVLGNYLPKTNQNHSIGIKLPWTFANEENWNKTHRLGGKTWVLCGLVLWFSALLPTTAMAFVAITTILAAVLIPTVYSFVLYKNHQRKGVAYDFSVRKVDKITRNITAIVVPVILLGTLFLMFTGNITVEYGETSFTVSATYGNDLTVEYAAIDNIEYRETFDAGSRILGFGSARLSHGTFQNKEFGTYTLFAYTGKAGAVVLTVDENTLVIVGKTPTETKELYQTLVTKTK